MRNLGLNLTFWLAAIILPTNSLALGLGEIEVNSFLNQPLKAEIEVISARPGEIDDLLVGLASRDAFTRAGLSRPNNLTDLRFLVQKSEDGESAVVLVTTKGSIKEPFLNFLVEADWSKGRLLREFTVLLDPPFYADTPTATSQSSTETAAITPEPEVPQPIVESNETDTGSTSEQQTITEPIALSDDDQQGSTESEVNTQESTSESTFSSVATGSETMTGDITIEKGDTLWGIASGLQGSGHSMSQIMLAIQRENPDAFGDGNINNLKVGAVLRIPDAGAFGEIDQQQAYAQVLEQNGLWDDYVARVTGNVAVAAESDADTSVTESASVSESESTEPSGELNLVTPGDGESDAAALLSEGDDANELRVKLALAEEELDASRVENVELESRIAELEARLSKFEELQKMVEIEDDSLAQLQSDQATKTDDPVISTETIDEEQKTADQDALIDELLTEEPIAEPELAEMAEESSEPVIAETETDALTDETMAEVVTDTAEEPVDTDGMTDDSLEQDQASEETPPVPVIVTETGVEEPSMLDGIVPEGILDTLSDILPSADSLAFDPLMLGGLGGILLLIVGLIIYKRKKSDEDVVVNEPIFATDGEEEDFTPIHLAEGAFDGVEDEPDTGPEEETVIPLASIQDEDEAEEDEFSKTAVISQDEMPTPTEEMPAVVVDEQDDILNEADVYLAYNLYDNAEDLLKQSIEANPERADYRSKLLDTHFATKNANAFISEAENLKSMGKAADRYWDRVMVMGYELAPENALFADAKDSDISAADLEIAKPEAADFDLGANEDDTNFSTTDFDLGEEDTNTFESTNFDVDDIGTAPELPDLDDLPEFEDEDDTRIPALENAQNDGESSDLDFSFDAEDSDESSAELDSMSFELPEDLDLGGDAVDEQDMESTAVLEAGTAVIDTEMLNAELEDDSVDLDDADATAINESDDKPESKEVIDFGMEDTAMMDSPAVSEVRDEIGDVMLDLDEDDDALAMDVDIGADNPQTDTFAPGDFEDPAELILDEADIDSTGFDDIEDLMLPDDVDEVSTKLDLARAFIDMGDAEGARSSLDEVLAEGNDDQKAEAQSLLDQM